MRWYGTDRKQNTGLPENTFSHVAIALGLHLIPQPDDVVKGERFQPTFDQEDVLTCLNCQTASASSSQTAS